MIKISGINIYPQEIEDCVNVFDGVLRSCVIPYRENGKNFLKLYIVMEEGKACDDDFIASLRVYIGNNLLKYNMPKVIECVDSLPLTQIGKVDFKKLQEALSKNQ